MSTEAIMDVKIHDDLQYREFLVLDEREFTKHRILKIKNETIRIVSSYKSEEDSRSGENAIRHDQSVYAVCTIRENGE